MSKELNKLSKKDFIRLFNNRELSEEKIEDLYPVFFTENEWEKRVFTEPASCGFLKVMNIMSISCKLGYFNFIDKLLSSMNNEVNRKKAVFDLLSNFLCNIEDLKSTTIKIIEEYIKPDNIYIILNCLLNSLHLKKHSFISFFIHEIFIIDKLKIIDYLSNNNNNNNNNNNDDDIKFNQLEIDYERKVETFFSLIDNKKIDDNTFYILKNIIYKEDLLYIRIKNEITFLERFVLKNIDFGIEIIKLHCEDINKKLFNDKNNLIQSIVYGLSSYLFRLKQGDFLNIISYLMIEKKADLLNKNNKGLNAFEMAIKGEVFEIAFELLKFNSRVIDLKNINKIFKRLYDHNQFELINYIFKNDLCGIKDFFKVKTFDVFLKTKHCLNKKISFFRDISIDIDFNDFEDEQCQNLLHSACKFNNIDFIRFFVEETNIDLNKKNDDGHTPLMIVLRKSAHSSNTCVEMFLKQKRFDPSITDKYNKSYLQNIKHKTKQKFFEKSLLKRTFEKINQHDENNNNENDCLLPINKKQKLN